MSTAPPPNAGTLTHPIPTDLPPRPTPAQAAPSHQPTHPREIKLVSHSPIFYWWPIWLLGYVMAFVTLFEGHRLAVVPNGAELRSLKGDEKTDRFELSIPKGSETKSLVRAEKVTENPNGEAVFRTRMSEKAWMGPLYCVILILTILITNIPLRGLWSFLVLMMLLILALVITLVPNGWENLLGAFGNLHIFINMAGYLFIATTVLILWVVSVFAAWVFQ